jgi:hypothetical protein
MKSINRLNNSFNDRRGGSLASRFLLRGTHMLFRMIDAPLVLGHMRLCHMRSWSRCGWTAAPRCASLLDRWMLGVVLSDCLSWRTINLVSDRATTGVCLILLHVRSRRGCRAAQPPRHHGSEQKLHMVATMCSSSVRFGRWIVSTTRRDRVQINNTRGLIR